MTFTQIIKSSGLELTHKQKTNLGRKFAEKAKSLNLTINRVPEEVLVNDYPDIDNELISNIMIDILRESGVING